MAPIGRRKCDEPEKAASRLGAVARKSFRVPRQQKTPGWSVASVPVTIDWLLGRLAR
jgi:hypothetical protein